MERSIGSPIARISGWIIIATLVLCFYPPALASSEDFSPPNPPVAQNGEIDARVVKPDSKTVGFAKGERLRYRVSWLGIPVGWAELRVRYEESEKGEPLLHLTSTARSSNLASLIYNVDDQVDSYLELDNLRSRSYSIRQSEGAYKADKRIYFYHSLGKAVYLKNQEKPAIYDLEPGAQDALSSLYFVRMQEIEVGKPVMVQSFIRRRNALVEVKVLGKEVISSVFGDVETYLLTPSSNYEGIFKRTGAIYVWLSADEQKVPVKMESKIAVGTITAELAEVDNETAKVFPKQK